MTIQRVVMWWCTSEKAIPVLQSPQAQRLQADEQYEASSPCFDRTDSSGSFRPLCSPDLEAKLNSPTLTRASSCASPGDCSEKSFEGGAGNMSPSLAALKGAKMHVKSKCHDEAQLLPFRRVKSVPSLLPESPHKADAHDAGNNESEDLRAPRILWKLQKRVPIKTIVSQSGESITYNAAAATSAALKSQESHSSLAHDYSSRTSRQPTF